jgi:hypothetical protein
MPKKTALIPIPFWISGNHSNDDAKRFGKRFRLADTILLSWGATEVAIDRLVLRQFTINDADRQNAKFLLARTFETKMGFLSQKGLFTKGEKYRIRAFQEKRNSLFHTPKGGLLPLLGRKEKNVLEKLAIESVRASALALARAMGNEADEETKEWVKRESPNYK